MTTPFDLSYRLIPLTQGQFAKVDPADFEWLNQWRWYLLHCKAANKFYAVRYAKISGKDRSVMMHREILGLAFGVKLMADHINGDTLLNVRSNLRVASPSQNCANSALRKGSSSGLKGAQKRGSKWRSGIRFKGVYKSLGSFSTPQEAHAAYAKAASLLFGEFARLK